MENQRRDKGFTLLELMLVLVLIGLVSSVVIPRLSTEAGSRELHTEAHRFALLAKYAHQQSLVSGQTLSLQKNDRSYQFLTLKSGQWQASGKLSTLTTLPGDIVLTISSGNSFWQKSLELENSEHSLGENQESPRIILWSSGEISPATAVFCLKNNNKTCTQVILEESGEISLPQPGVSNA